MGAGGSSSGGVHITYARNLKITDKPNSRSDRYDKDSMTLIQSRWYDEKGRAVRNRDYVHQNAHANHFFPHDHNWNWTDDKGLRGKEPLLPDYENYK